MKPTVFSFIILLLILFSACENKPVTKKDLLGLKDTKTIELYGEPVAAKLFLLSDSLREYEYNLLNLYPNYKTDTINIKELLWEKGDQKTAVWFIKKEGEWIAIDNLIWDNNIKF